MTVYRFFRVCSPPSEGLGEANPSEGVRGLNRGSEKRTVSFLKKRRYFLVKEALLFMKRGVTF
jgi:hypothetical protein